MLQELKGTNTAATADAEVIERILKGEKACYAVLMRRHNQTLYRAVRSYLHNAEDVEDTMQDTYVKAFAKLSQFKGESAFGTWLVRIGINEALQRLRRARRVQALEAGQEKLERLPNGDGMDPEKRMIREQQRQLLEQAVDGLPESYRAVYMLREVEGMGVGEVAGALGLSESNVKVRLFRAKAMLKEQLTAQMEPATAFEFGNERCDRLVKRVLDRI